MKRRITFALLLIVLLVLSACAKKPAVSLSAGVMPADSQTPLLDAEKQADISQDEKYDAVFLNISIEEFLDAGFKFGDSCDIVFSNGLSFEDIPFYNGYYVRTGQPLIVGYPGYKYIAVTCNNQGLWNKSGLKDGDSAMVTVREEGKYIDIQETLSQTYSNDRSEYSDDIAFANFRALSGGTIKKDFIFRGASPVDDAKNRAIYANALLKENEISFILDLADSVEDIEGYFYEEGFASEYAKNLYEAGQVATLDMSSNYGSDAFKQKLAAGLSQMLNSKGKIYIHCLEGKDRTGFVCMLLEALAGASYDEMLSDYMKTYDNYYHVTMQDTPKKYNAIVDLYFNAFASYLHGTEDLDVLKTASYTEDAEKYLLDAGMTQQEIEELKKLISG